MEFCQNKAFVNIGKSGSAELGIMRLSAAVAAVRAWAALNKLTADHPAIIRQKNGVDLVKTRPKIFFPEPRVALAGHTTSAVNSIKWLFAF
jgi:hypothetical protein